MYPATIDTPHCMSKGQNPGASVLPTTARCKPIRVQYRSCQRGVHNESLTRRSNRAVAPTSADQLYESVASNLVVCHCGVFRCLHRLGGKPCLGANVHS